MTQFIRTWRFATIYTLLIIGVSLAPLGKELPLGDVPLMDKWVHFVMYGTMFIAAIMDIRIGKTEVRSVSKTASTLLIYAITLGGLMEICQGFTTYRSADWWDFVANSIGATLGLCIFSLISGSNRRTSKNAKNDGF